MKYKIVLLSLMLLVSSCAIFKRDYKKQYNAEKRIDILYIHFVDEYYAKNKLIKTIVINERADNPEVVKKAQDIKSLFLRYKNIKNVKFISNKDLANNGLLIKNKIYQKSESEEGVDLLWTLAFIGSVGVIPMIRDYNQSLDITSISKSKTKKFSIKYEYKMYFSLFLLPIFPFRYPEKGILHHNKNLVDMILTEAFD